MRTNPAKLANLPPHVLQHIGYRFHDLVVNCEYGESDMKLCNESNAVLCILFTFTKGNVELLHT